MSDLKNEVIRMLLGESETQGIWFEDLQKVNMGKRPQRRFWWRNYLRIEAKNYEDKIDSLQSKLQASEERVKELEKDCAFFRCCALSGEIPEEGSEPSKRNPKTDRE